VNLQASGGLAGALLLDPADGYPTLPSTLAPLYLDGAYQLLLIQHIFLNMPSQVNVSYAFQMKSYLEWSNMFSNATANPLNTVPYQSINPAPIYSPTLPTGYAFLANGHYQPFVNIQPDDATLFRMVNAGSMYMVELELVPWGACTMQLVARDGIFQALPYLLLKTVVLLPGSRSDVAILCPASTVNMNITVAIVANASRNLELGTEGRGSQSVLFTLRVREGGVVKKALPTQAFDITASQYLTNIQNARTVVDNMTKIDPTTKAQSVQFGAMAPTVAMFGGNINNVQFGGFSGETSMNSQLATMCVDFPPTVAYPIRATQGSLGEFTPPQPSGLHPYHHHVNPMQVKQTNRSDYILRVGEWRDVIPTESPNDVTPTIVHVRPTAFTSPIAVIHCHILMHEDMGMMNLYNLIDNTDPRCQALVPDDNVVVGSASTLAPVSLLLVALLSAAVYF
jgi:FtsP/CotA-like multicopper oxidase with cupredoxin domain